MTRTWYVLLAVTLLFTIFGWYDAETRTPVPETDSSTEILHYHDCYDVRTPAGWTNTVSIAGGGYVDGLNVNDVLHSLCPEIYFEGMPPR